jgi:hypothetical protein
VQDDPFGVPKLWAWLGVALLALLVHETRPYKVRASERLVREISQ